MFEESFPRRLTDAEKKILFRILPENKPGYRHYRELLNHYYLSGKGDTADTFILTKSGIPDSDASFITPVFASGTFNDENYSVDVSINEESYDTILFSIDLRPLNGTVNKNIIYPEWVPGDKAPGDDSEVREVILQNKKYILAIAPSHKKLWVYSYETGVNHFLNPGAFFNHLCLIKNIREAAIVLVPKLLFDNLANYSDNELISAFHLYNKTLKKMSIEMPDPEMPAEKKSLLSKFLKKDRN